MLEWIDNSPFTLIIDKSLLEVDGLWGKVYTLDRVIVLHKMDVDIFWHEMTHVAQLCKGHGMDTWPLGLDVSSITEEVTEFIKTHYHPFEFEVEAEAYMVQIQYPHSLKLRIQVYKYLVEASTKFRQKT